MTGFAGLGPDFLAFFRDLAAAQNRDWFQANKRRYEAAVKEPLRDLVVGSNEALAARGVPLSGDPRRSVSRINRDVRFSADKRPYKDYAALTFTRAAGEMSPGLLYVQFSPDECFAGIGFYAVDPAHLAAMRAGIAADQPGWVAVENALAKAGAPLEQGEALKRMPRGFEALAGSPVENALRLKAHVAKLRLEPERLGPDLPDRIGQLALGAMPLLQFGWRVLNDPARQI
ncbi:DUF2461 domain-containing protein [Blastomonas sp. UPD001]|uniref:DUF2461 domain-containing protein n=1 Tax=Blastomonas sp. UPD001 TaxID=2217673 RepID=UPI000E349DB4|nr:DUF2461 domain-containing protein [Blastomonas sp. UPD001]